VPGPREAIVPLMPGGTVGAASKLNLSERHGRKRRGRSWRRARFRCGDRKGCKTVLSLDLIHHCHAIHLTAGIIGEAESMLSRMQKTGCAGASPARVLDRIDPLAKTRRQEMNGRSRFPAAVTEISSPVFYSKNSPSEYTRPQLGVVLPHR
jgi:hypothetical protein